MPNLGNPDLKSFKSTYIRRVIVDLAYVYVHREILNQTEELLIRAVDRGVQFSDSRLPVTLSGYEADGSPEQRLGLSLTIPTDRDLTGIEEGIGFVKDGNTFTFNFEAKTIDLPTYFDEEPTKIASRQLKEGMSGKDVKFVNLYLGMENHPTIERFTAETTQGVLYLQERFGIPKTGEIDWYTWGSIVPRQTYLLSPGSAGPKVRALQSALRCYGYNVPVTSRFGTETLKAVIDFQQKNGLRNNGRCSIQEWSLLFDYH